MFEKREKQSPEEFWREYEEKFDEKVLARGLGRYISGWGVFDSQEWNNLWGLLIISSKGFRFHHFPKQSWLQTLVIRGDSEGSKERIIFFPNEMIKSVEIREETRWWVKIISLAPPRIIIHCGDEDGNERTIIFEAEVGIKELEEKLRELAFIKD